MRRSLLKLMILIPMLMASVLLHADSLTTPGTIPGTSYCGPFGCTGYFNAYQQLYNGQQFGGNVTLNSMTFYNLPGTTGAVPGNYTVSLSTTTAANTAALTSATGVPRWTYDSNSNTNTSLGGTSDFNANSAGSTTIFNGSLGATNGSITFTIPDGFTFDGSKQNLLLSVKFTPTANSPTDPNQVTFWQDAVDANAATSILFGALFDDNGDFVLDENGNWIQVAYIQDDSTPTTFDYTAAPVPEPSSIVLLISGLAGMGGMARRKFFR